MKLNKLNHIKLYGKINNQEKNIIIYYNNFENIDDIIKSNINYNDIFFEIDKDDDKILFENNKKKYPNLRLHWNDVSSNNFIIKSIKYEIYNHLTFFINIIKNTDNNNYNITLFNTFLNNIIQIKNNVNILFDIINNDNNKNNTHTYSFNFINKIKYRYNNNDNNICVEKYFTVIINYINIIKKYIDYIIKNVKKYINNNNNSTQLIFNIFIKLSKIYNNLNIVNHLFNDIYTIRRILDKNYISNCIIFSKSNTIYNYVFSLINLFDFKII